MRSGNAGLVLLAQSLAEFPPDVAHAVFASAGCRAVLGGLHPADADLFSTAWGESTRYETTVSYSESTTDADQGSSCDHVRPVDVRPPGGRGPLERVRPRQRPRPRPGVVSLTRSDGRRVGPVHVDVRN